MPNEQTRILEEKIAYLERHVTEQDKAMLEMAEDIAKLRRELANLQNRAGDDRGPGGGDFVDERPPHY